MEFKGFTDQTFSFLLICRTEHGNAETTEPVDDGGTEEGDHGQNQPSAGGSGGGGNESGGGGGGHNNDNNNDRQGQDGSSNEDSADDEEGDVSGGKKTRNKLTNDMKMHMLDDMWMHKE